MSQESGQSDWDVVLEDQGDYLYVLYQGAFDAARVRQAIERMAAQVRVPGKRWNLINDLREAEFLEAAVHDLIVEATAANAPFVRKSAVIDVHGAKRFISESAVAASGRTNIKLCSTLAEAERWIAGETESL